MSTHRTLDPHWFSKSETITRSNKVMRLTTNNVKTSITFNESSLLLYLTDLKHY